MQIQGSAIVQGGGGSGGSANVPTAGTTPPAPLYSPSEAPTGVNPAVFVEDVDGNWHAESGVDVTTPTDPTGASGAPTVPRGILVHDRITYFRDNGAPTQGGKNAFLSVNHEASSGTSYNNQDRALWLGMSNVFAVINQFSISANIVTFIVQNLKSGFTPGVGFKKGQRIVATSLAIGTYLNNAKLSVLAAGPVVAGAQTITANDSGFTHADVALTSDTGQLDQSLYAMENLQAELDIVGTPQLEAAVDGEFSTCSLQVSDQHIGDVGSPNNGVTCIRAQLFREVGSGTWGSIPPSVIFVKATNFSAVNGQGMTLEGIRVGVNDDGGVSNNTAGRALHIQQPSDRMAGGNTGIFIGNFGTNAADFAIEVLGGQSFFGGTVGVPSLFPTSGTTGGEIQSLASITAQGLKSSAIAAPAGPDVEVIGTAGMTHYTYVVVGRDQNGNPSPGTPRTITNGNATLDGTNWNFVEVGPNPVMGPTTFDVYRTLGGATQGKIASVAPSFNDYGHFGSFVIQDKGLVADGSTCPTVNSSGSIAAAGPLSSGQYTVAGLPVGSEGQMLYATNGRKVGELAGAGTGVPVYFSSGSWRVFSTDAAVAS